MISYVYERTSGYFFVLFDVTGGKSLPLSVPACIESRLYDGYARCMECILWLAIVLWHLVSILAFILTESFAQI